MTALTHAQRKLAKPLWAAREKLRLAKRDRTGPRDRTRENRARTIARAIVREASVIPAVHASAAHGLFAAARLLIPSSSTLTTLRDPLDEDLRSEFILAVLEHRDPMAAVKRYRRIEQTWGRITTPRLEQFATDAD